MPNSAARLMDGASLPEVRGRTTLVLGGGGRVVSGPIDGRRDRGVRGGSMLGSSDGLRNLSGRGPGADGVRSGGSAASRSRGDVPARLRGPKGAGSRSPGSRRDPKPPYPSFFPSRDGAPPLPLVEDDVPK